MSAVNLLVAGLLDGAIGDPRWFPHPVRILGRCISWYEGFILPTLHTPFSQLVAGIILTLGLPAFCFLGSWWLIQAGYQLHPLVGDGLWILMAYSTLAVRDLANHAMAVYHALETHSLEKARSAVSMIVGRDTADLGEPEVVRATVETVAESTSDGVIAPLFYLIIGGPPLALAYKAINTLDSMIGHLTPPYRHFGWASARVDDVVNWIPARVTALFMVLGAALRFGTGKQAWHVLWRDGGKHTSPNSGRPEAAMAGALSLSLGGINFYDGIAVVRPTLGHGETTLRAEHIRYSVQLMWIVSGVGFFVALVVLSL